MTRGVVYRVIVKEPLDPSWAEWFEGFDLGVTANGETTITGCIRDQAALHGLLDRVRNLNLTVCSLFVVTP